MAILTAEHLKALKHAVTLAKVWRNIVTTDPNPQALIEYDKFLVEARAAIRVIEGVDLGDSTRRSSAHTAN